MSTIRIIPPQGLTIEVVGCMAERGAYYVGGGVFHLPRGGRPYREGLLDARETGPAEWLLAHGHTEAVDDDGEPYFRGPGPSRVGVVEPVVVELAPAECAECGGTGREPCRACDGHGRYATGTCVVLCSTCRGSSRGDAVCLACGGAG